MRSKKYKKICATLNYIEHLLILASASTECVSISAFASITGIPTGNTGSAVRLKTYAKSAGIKNYKWVIKKKKKKHDKIVLLAETTSKNMKVLISKALIDSYISHDEFVSVNNALKENDYVKKEK